MLLQQDSKLGQALKPSFTTLKTISDEVDDVLLTKVLIIA